MHKNFQMRSEYGLQGWKEHETRREISNADLSCSKGMFLDFCLLF